MGVGYAIDSLQCYVENTVDIKFNALDQIKIEFESLSVKPMVKIKKMTMCKSGVLTKKTIENFCLFISPTTWRGYIENIYHVLFC